MIGGVVWSSGRKTNNRADAEPFRVPLEPNGCFVLLGPLGGDVQLGGHAAVQSRLTDAHHLHLETGEVYPGLALTRPSKLSCVAFDERRESLSSAQKLFCWLVPKDLTAARGTRMPHFPSRYR